MKDFTGARVVNFEEVVRQRRLRKKAHAKILRSRPRTRVRKVETAFAMIPLKWAVSAAEATNNPGIALVVLLAYLAWETKSATFVLSNERLRELGVNRW